MYFPFTDKTGKEVLSIIQEIENIEKYISEIQPNSIIQIELENRYNYPNDLLSSYEARLKSDKELSEYDTNNNMCNISVTMNSTYLPLSFNFATKEKLLKKCLNTSSSIFKRRSNASYNQLFSLYNSQNILKQTQSKTPNQSSSIQKPINNISSQQKMRDLTELLLNKSKSQMNVFCNDNKPNSPNSKKKSINLTKYDLYLLNLQSFDLSPSKTQVLTSNQSPNNRNVKLNSDQPQIQPKKPCINKPIKVITIQINSLNKSSDNINDLKPQILNTSNESLNNLNPFPNLNTSPNGNNKKNQYQFVSNSIQYQNEVKNNVYNKPQNTSNQFNEYNFQT